jgi:hypothetical protein
VHLTITMKDPNTTLKAYQGSHHAMNMSGVCPCDHPENLLQASYALLKNDIRYRQAQYKPKTRNLYMRALRGHLTLKDINTQSDVT